MFGHAPMRAVWAAAAALALVTTPAGAAIDIPDYQFAGPAFGLATNPDGSLLVADAGAGIVEFRKGNASLITALPGISDVSPVGRRSMFAITAIGDPATEMPDSAWGVYVVRGGNPTKVADLLDFEKAVNPDGNTGPEGIDSNPFDVERLTGSSALVADAGANDLLIVDDEGNIDWVATFPEELVSTDNLKAVAGCPTPPPGFEFACFLPPMLPAQAVPTSVAIGPDGAYYVGELKGFPAPTGASRIWRIEPGTRHAMCGASPACSVVASGFTSIVDLELDSDGTLYVTEIDEASWAAVEPFLPFQSAATGGTVNACDIATWSCSELASGLTIPSATTVGKDGTVYALVEALLPTAKVIALP